MLCHTENAFRAKMDFSGLMDLLRVKTPDEPLALYESLLTDELANNQLELIRPILAALASQYGFRYEPPTLSEEGKMLITNSPPEFIRRYAHQLRRLDMDPLGIQYI